MARARDGLLPGMEARPLAAGGARYRVKHQGRWVPLGTDLDEALRRVLDLRRGAPDEGTLRGLWRQFVTYSKRWAKLAPGTRADYELAWTQIDAVLGGERVDRINPPRIARYVHVERARSPRRADIEKTLLSNLFKFGILTGACQSNPTAGVEPHGSEPSDVMPSADAIASFAGWLEQQTPQRRMLSWAMRFMSLTGARRVEFLDATWLQVDRTAGVVRLPRAKQRGKQRGSTFDGITIGTELAALLDEMQAGRRDADCPYLFPTQHGNAYTTEGFETLFQRCVVAWGGERFNFHALRRYYVTTHRQRTGVLPNLHRNPAVTSRVYDATREEKRKSL